MLDTIDHATSFAKLQAALGSSVDQFYLAPLPHLATSGIPVLPTAVAAGNVAMPMISAPDAPLANGEQLTVEAHWYGITFTMNEKLTQDIINGTTAGGALSGLIVTALGAAGVLTGGLATLIGAAVGAAFSAKVAQMKITDNGTGLYWPVTWPQWAVLLAACPAGPVGLLAAAMAVLHPLRN